MRGVHSNHTVKNPNGVSLWDRMDFPTQDVNVGVSYNGYWIGKGCTLTGKPLRGQSGKGRLPYCWTPTKTFSFGGKRFVALYPCMAYETQNFGWVIQRGPYGMVLGQE